MSVTDTNLIAPVTAAQMVDAYQSAVATFKENVSAIAEAETRLNAAFGVDYGTWRLIGDDRLHARTVHWNASNPSEYIEGMLDHMRRTAWGKIIAVTGVKKMMSIKRIAELDERLEKGELPDITTETIIDFLTSFVEGSAQMQEEIVRSAYEALRPSVWAELKTQKKNLEFGLQVKTILSGVLASRFSGGMEVSHYSRNRIAEIDKAFHVLDGKGVPDGYITPLVDAVCGAEAVGETEYFSFKKFNNGNLHLKFKRVDLLNEFNRICAGMVLHR